MWLHTFTIFAAKSIPVTHRCAAWINPGNLVWIISSAISRVADDLSVLASVESRGLERKVEGWNNVGSSLNLHWPNLPWAKSYKHKFSCLKIILGKRSIFLENQKNFLQEFLVQLAGQITEKNCQKFFKGTRFGYL